MSFNTRHKHINWQFHSQLPFAIAQALGSICSSMRTLRTIQRMKDTRTHFSQYFKGKIISHISFDVPPPTHIQEMAERNTVACRMSLRIKSNCFLFQFHIRSHLQLYLMLNIVLCLMSCSEAVVLVRICKFLNNTRWMGWCEFWEIFIYDFLFPKLFRSKIPFVFLSEMFLLLFWVYVSNICQSLLF